MKDLFWGFKRNVKNSEVIQLPSLKDVLLQHIR